LSLEKLLDFLGAEIFKGLLNISGLSVFMLFLLLFICFFLGENDLLCLIFLLVILDLNELQGIGLRVRVLIASSVIGEGVKITPRI
jgi:hypothetical protein